MRLPSFVRHAGTVATLVGLTLIVYAGVITFRARAHQEAFAVSLPSPPSDGEPVVREPIAEGLTIGEIQVDRIGLRTVSAHGETDAILALGAGPLADTPWLDQRGNVVLAGHRDTVFRSLEQIRVGDVIDVTGHSVAMRYIVTSTTIVEPDDLSVLAGSSDNTLTLITCFPFVYIGHAPRRFIVRATEIAQPF